MAALDTAPPLTPGGHPVENTTRVFDTVDSSPAMTNSPFLLAPGTAMVPTQLGVVPLHTLMSDLDRYGTPQAVIVRPQAAVMGVFAFTTAWNDFFRPLIVLDPNDGPTVQVALSALASGYHTDHSLMLAGASLAVPPVVAIFILPARRIVGGIVQGAVKG